MKSPAQDATRTSSHRDRSDMTKPDRENLSPELVLVQKLASGGMGEVLLCHFAGDRTLGPGLVVAKRVLSPRNTAANEMFAEEARLSALLRHENIIRTFGLHTGDRSPLLLLEYFCSVPLSQILNFAQRSKNPIPISLALQVLRAAALGLHFVHTLSSDGAHLGLVHRDVNPSNILVGFDGSIKIIDFGIAKAVDSDRHTQTGTLKGKMGYIAPEQVDNAPIDCRTDLWGLGVSLWETLTARRLFRAPSVVGTLQQVVSKEVAPPSSVRREVPKSLDDLCMSLLDRSPDGRPVSCVEVARDLERILQTSEPMSVAEFIDESFPDEGRPFRSRQTAQSKIPSRRVTGLVHPNFRFRHVRTNERTTPDDATRDSTGIPVQIGKELK